MRESIVDIVREEIEKSSPIGLEAKKILDSGELIPEELRERLLALKKEKL